MFGLLRDIFGDRKQSQSVQKHEKSVATGRSFQLTVEDCLYIKMRGLVVMGTVNNGSVVTGQEVSVSSLPEKHVVVSIEKDNKTSDTAQSGERVALFFSDLKQEQVPRGAIISR